MDASANDRRGFFREAFTRLVREVATRTEQRVAPRRYFRPPGAADEMAFLASCTRCGDCLPVCPVHAIIKAPPGAGLAAGTPIIDPAIQACVVCTDMPCAHACATGALVPPAGGGGEIHKIGRAAWKGRGEISGGAASFKKKKARIAVGGCVRLIYVIVLSMTFPIV